MSHVYHRHSTCDIRRSTVRRLAFPSAFTLNELLIVVAIIVIALALAVPAFNVITGSRSIEAAENIMSSFLAIARSEAVGLQEPRGVIFFQDPGTERVTLLRVYYPPNGALSQIELVGGGQREALLPVGVGLQVITNNTTAVGPDAVKNSYPWPRCGVVMFDGSGRVQMDEIKVVANSLLDERLGAAPERPIVGNSIRPNVGFILYDQPAYDGQQDDPARRAWLFDNAVPILVNRYSGTLLRAQ